MAMTVDMDPGHAALTQKQRSAVNLAAAGAALIVRRWPNGHFALYSEGDCFMGTFVLDGSTVVRTSVWFKRDLERFNRFARHFALQMEDGR